MMSLLVSPKRKRMAEVSGAPAHAGYITAGTVHTTAVERNLCNFDGFLLPRATELRELGSGARRSKVVDLVLMDRTAPVMVTFWNTSAEKAQAAAAAAVEGGVAYRVRLTNMRVGERRRSEWTGDLLTKVRYLETTGGPKSGESSAMELGVDPASPWLCPCIGPVHDTAVLLTDFRSVLQQPSDQSFTVSLRGTVRDVSEAGFTQKGNPTRKFQLYDTSGASLPCCAVGPHAEDAVLTESSIWECWFAKGLFRDDQCTIWCFWPQRVLRPVGNAG